VRSVREPLREPLELGCPSRDRLARRWNTIVAVEDPQAIRASTGANEPQPSLGGAGVSTDSGLGPVHGENLAWLRNVLVLTVRKSFWASAESVVFPHRVFAPTLVGHSTGRVNTVLLLAKALFALLRHRPKLILLGSAHRLVPVLLILRRLRILRTKLIVTNQVYFGPRLARFADRVIVYSRRETEGRPNYVYLPIPADGAFDEVEPHRADAPYVFSGGGTLRDFATLFEAVEGADVRLVVVTHSQETLGAVAPPPNARVLFTMPLQDFLSYAAGSLFVVVPLLGADTPHGHTTIAQALSLGKAVVTTRGAAVADYVRDGVEGLLVEPSDVGGYREAILRLLGDEDLRRRCERASRERAAEFSYAAFASSIVALCREVLTE
jgi:UDP:flavonoid glycosyltransferase YjiC (YdhE family)